MTDAEYAEQRARVQKLMDKWFLPLGLKYWMVDVSFSRQPYTESDTNSAGNWQTLARCETRWEYLHGAMKWYLPAVAEIEEDADLERHFLHECVHMLVNEMREDWDIKHEERVVTQLANAFYWVHTTMEKTHAIEEMAQPETD